jgi:hypothetical protein
MRDPPRRPPQLLEELVPKAQKRTIYWEGKEAGLFWRERKCCGEPEPWAAGGAEMRLGPRAPREQRSPAVGKGRRGPSLASSALEAHGAFLL